MDEAALQHLRSACPVMAGLIARAEPCALAPQRFDPFRALAEAIAHQQLHGAAARTILARFVATCGRGAFPTPEEVLAAETAKLRAAGFSGSKIAALRDLAAKTLAGVVPSRAALQKLDEAQIIGRLTQVRGVGRWTVEMLLIFQLGRPDVLPVDDFGVRNGFRLAYGLRALPHPRALASFGECFAPWRSVAAWYLWRAVDLARAGNLPEPALRVRLRRPKGLRKARSARAPSGASSAPPRPADARTRARRPRGVRSRAPASRK